MSEEDYIEMGKYERLEQERDRLNEDLALKAEHLDQCCANIAKLRAKLTTLTEAVGKLIAYRDRVGPLGFQLEKLDDFIHILRQERTP